MNRNLVSTDPKPPRALIETESRAKKWPRRFRGLAAALLSFQPMVHETWAQPEPAVTHALSEAVRPIRIAAHQNDEADLGALKDWIGDRRLVALGELTHGAHEPLALRNQLFQLIVKELGFTAIALETGFSESKAIQRFIDGDPGEVRELLHQQLSWGFGAFPENRALIEWMRAYNADARHVRKLRFYGIDLSGAGDGAFPHARRAVDLALDLMDSQEVEGAKKLRRDLEPLLTLFSSSKYSELKASERQQLGDDLNRLVQAIQAHQAHVPTGKRADLGELAWALQSVEVARQLDRMFAVYPAASAAGPGIPPDAWRAMEARDLGMAENVRWALQAEGDQGKLLVFAHNVHVMNAKVRGGIWATLKEPPAPMGHHLRRFYGDKVCLLGTSATSAAGGLPELKIHAGSWDAAFAGLGTRQFLLPTRSPRFSPTLVRWLGEMRPLHANLGTEVSVVVAQAFDGVVFLRELTPSKTD